MTTSVVHVSIVKGVSHKLITAYVHTLILLHVQYGGLASVVVLYDRSWRCFGFPWPRCIIIATCFTVAPRQLFPDVTAGAAPRPPPAPFPADANSPGFSPGLLDLRPPSGLSAKHWFLWKKSSASVFFPFFSSLAKRAVGTMDRSVFVFVFCVDFFHSFHVALAVRQQREVIDR